MWIYVYPNNTETEITNLYVGIPFPSSITLDKSSISLTTVWQTEQLTATLSPTPCDQSVTWSSDDTTIATVSTTGLVTCVAPWECTITATTVNNLTATCGVTDQSWWLPTANTLWYINMNQSDAVFTDYEGHTVTNNWITYDASGVSEWCGYNNSDWKRLYSDFNVGESFPTSFTIMAFMKPTWNHYTSDHPMWITLANASTKVTWGIWFSQSNSQVQFNHLRENIAWDTMTYNYNPLNTWHHYALTYDGSLLIGYIDGNQVVSFYTSGSGSWTWPSWWLTVFGRNFPGLTNTIQGYVDEAICEDKVWSAQDIQDYLALYSY